jgi:hypothetical protein
MIDPLDVGGIDYTKAEVEGRRKEDSLSVDAPQVRGQFSVALPPFYPPNIWDFSP